MSRPGDSLAVLSQKGGVGKSTVVLGLTGAAWSQGLRVLVVDLDPQANTTAALDPSPHGYSVGDVLADARPGVAADAIVVSGWGETVHLLPADTALENRNLPEGHDSAMRLRVALTGVAEEYDLVLLDCPPSLGELTRNGLAAAHRTLVVTEPGYFSLQGAAKAMEAIEVVRKSANLRLAPAGIVVNRVRPQLSEHRYRLEELRATFGALVLDPPVPERTAVQQAQGAGVPVQALSGNNGARELTQVFDALLRQVLAAAASAGAPPRLAAGTDAR